MLNWFVSREYNRLDALLFYAMGILVAIEWYWTMIATFFIGILFSTVMETFAERNPAPARPRGDHD